MTMFDTFIPKWPGLERRISPKRDVYAAILFLREKGCRCERMGRLHRVHVKKSQSARHLQNGEIKKLARMMGWGVEAVQ